MRQSTVLFMTALVLCGGLFALLSPTAHVATAAPDDAPLTFHTSLVDLLNADKSQWSMSLGSLLPAADGNAAAATTATNNDTAAAVSWMDMREVWVEGQPSESAASLLFALPPPTTSYYQMEDVDNGADDAAAEATADDTVQGDGVLLRAQRRQLFGLPAFAFHGLACEEYNAAERRRHSSSSSSSVTVRGRCYFVKDSGEDFFFNYRVEPQQAAPGQAPPPESEETAQHHPHSSAANRRRRARRADGAGHGHGEKPTAAVADATPRKALKRLPQTSAHVSEGGVWAEFIVLPGAETGVVGTEGDVRVGSVLVSEHLTKEYDAADSARVQLSFTLTLRDTAAAASDVPTATIHLRLKGVTGALCEQAEQHATMAQQASRTSVFNRWIFPVVYIGCLYGLVYGVAWLQANRKATATTPAATATTTAVAPGSVPSAAKKRQ